MKDKRQFIRTTILVLIAIVCSLILTYITVTPPGIPTDWARLDAAGIYVPKQVDYPWTSYGIQIALWLGMILAISGQRSAKEKDLTAKTQRTPREDKKEKKAPYELWMLVAIIGVGFGLRVHVLGKLPLIIDEIGFAAQASDILHGQQVPIFAPGHNANPSVYSWLVAGAMELFGQNRFAMRLLPLVFGTLTIAAIYLLGRRWWSGRVGLIAAAFLATYPAHIFFSRMSLYNIIDPFFAILALACLKPGMKKHQAILVGMLAGVAQYFYHGSRLGLVLIAIYIGLSVATYQLPVKEKSQKRIQIRQLIWMVVAFGIVALPRFAPMVINNLPVTGNEQGLRLPADLAANSLRAVLAWVGQKDVSPFWLSDRPLLEWPALAAFGIGLVVSFWRWREGRYGVLIAAVGLTTIFGGMMWAAAPLYVRYMTAIPAIALLVAGGLTALSNQRSAKDKTEDKDLTAIPEGGFAQTQRTQREDKRSQYRAFLQIILVGVICGQGIWAAGEQMREAVAQVSESQWIEDNLAQRAAALPAGTAAVLIVPENFGEIQKITIAHYVAAYGERRAVVVNSDGEETLDEQVERLGSPFELLVFCG